MAKVPSQLLSVPSYRFFGFVSQNGWHTPSHRERLPPHQPGVISDLKHKCNLHRIGLPMVQSREEIESNAEVYEDVLNSPKLLSMEDSEEINTQNELILDPIEYDSGPLDDAWAQALETHIKLDTSPKMAKKLITKSSNKRMQMFQFLSQPIVEVGIIGLVLLSSFLVAINTLEDLPDELRQGINIVDTLCVYVFAVEFFLRWWAAGQFQIRYLAKPLVSIDAIVVILPLILSGLLPIWDFGVMAGLYPGVAFPSWLLTASSSSSSALLNLRLLRILKFQRVLTDEKTYMKFELALGMKKSDVRPYQLQLARVLISIFTLASVSTGLIYAAEHEVNPQIPDYFTALYFGLTTLTTVGFGDITPVTTQGRFVVIMSILAGVAIIPAQAASLAEAYLDFQNERSMGRGQRKVGKSIKMCRNCGNGPHRRDALFCWSCGDSLRDQDVTNRKS